MTAATVPELTPFLPLLQRLRQCAVSAAQAVGFGSKELTGSPDSVTGYAAALFVILIPVVSPEKR